MTAPSFTYSGNVYTAGTAGTVDFALTSTSGNPISYLQASHIHVYKSINQGSSWTELTRPSQWNFTSGGTVARLATGISSGEWVKVQRITPSSPAYVTFQSSSLLTADQLNDDTLFNTYLNQERYDQGDQLSALATAATSAAAAATAASTTATATANSALSASSAASSTANSALSASAAATTTSNTALAQSATALSNSAAAVTTANTASASAASAVTTANTANAKADSAITAISSSAVFTPVANVAAIPGSPTNGQNIQVTDSTGIESFTPLAGLPVGFVGDSGIAARIQYSSGTWNWFGYFATNSDARYLKQTGGTLTGQLKADDSTSTAAPVYSFDGDTDTGIAHTGANELALVTGGTPRLTFDSSGNATFANSVTIPAGSTVTGYLDTTTAASTYQTQAGMSSYVPTSGIGTTVQAYDADLAAVAGLSTTGLISRTGAGTATTVTAPSGTIVGTSDTQTLTNKTLTDPAIIGTVLEDVFTITDGAAFEIDPGNGSIQLITLGANRTPKATNFAAGEAVTLMVDDGSAYTLTWSDSTFGGSGVVWKTGGGNAPTLNTTGYTVITLWKVGTQVYGARVGDA